MRGRKVWLVAALVLFGIAAFLMSRGDEASTEKSLEDRVHFPRRLRQEERERMKTRQVLAVPEATPAQPAQPTVRDPVLAALPRGGKSVMVLEANALRNSPIGELLLQCLRRRRGEESLAALTQRTGVDVLQDLDRVAVSDGALVLSGQFQKAKWKDLNLTPSAYGKSSTLYEPPRTLPDGGTRLGNPPMFGVWNDQLVVMGDTREEVQRALDQVEGGGTEQPPLREDQTYGEIYGVVSAADLTRLLPPDQAGLAERLKSVASSAEIHVDATRDVGLVADVKGSDPQSMDELAKSLGAALSLGRLKLQAEGKNEIAEFLDLARVQPRPDGKFSLEMAMPLEMLEKQLAFCRTRDPEDGGAAVR